MSGMKTNTKQSQMTKTTNFKHYDLEDRTLEFAMNVRALIEDGKQVVRSSGSVGANYIEANESLSKKDFFRIFQD
jgi:four helix bundle protein